MIISACQPGISQKITGRKIRRILLVGMIFIFICLLFSERAPLNAAAASSADGWTRLSDPLAAGGVISHLVAAPSNPDILYALLEGLFSTSVHQRLIRSQDGGASWQMVPVGNHYFNSLAVDPENSDTLYATESNQLIKSNDSGQSWTELYPFGRMVVAPAPGRIYLAGSDFARSLDGGITWEHSSWNSGTYLDFIVVSPFDPNYIIATPSVQNPHWLVDAQYSLDGGLTWQMFLLNGNSVPIFHLAFDTQNSNRIYLTKPEMWTTGDNGTTWTKCGTVPETSPSNLLAIGDRVYMIPPYDIYSHTDPTRYVYMSEDHCATWWKSIHGLPATVNSLVGDARSPGRLLAATGGYGIFISTNGGTTWQESNTGLTSPAKVSKLAVAPSDPNMILAGSRDPRPGVYRSSDGGVTWSPALLTIEPTSILIHPLDPQKAWISTTDGIYSTMDGSIWSQVYFLNQVNDLAISPDAPDSPYAVLGDGVNGLVIRFQNYWQSFPVANLKNIQTLVVNPWDANDLLIGGTTGSDLYPTDALFYRTQDGGQTWHQVFATSSPAVDIAIDPNNPQNRYLVTKNGVHRSTDSGETWTDWSGETVPILFSTGNLAVDDLGGVYVFTPGKIYYRLGNDSDWKIVPTNIFSTEFGALWRGNPPFLLEADLFGLWKKNLPPIHKIWFPILSN